MRCAQHPWRFCLVPEATDRAAPPSLLCSLLYHAPTEARSSAPNRTSGFSGF